MRPSPSRAIRTIRRVLVVEDDIVDHMIIGRMFERSRLKVQVDAASSISAARSALQTAPYDCMLVNLKLPDGSGMDLVKELLDPACEYGTASIVVTELDNEDVAAEAIKAGAQDCLIKRDINERTLTRAVLHSVERWRLRVELGQTRRELEASIAQLEEANLALQRLARVDPLTGLANRRAFDEALHRLVEEAARGRRFALILLDLDNFKHFNDTHGHDVGDDLLRTFGGVLKMSGRSVDTVARYGGEEFALLLVDVSSAEAFDIADRIRTETTKQLARFGRVTASFGVGLFEPRRMEASTLVRRVDEALYLAKSMGRDRVMNIPPSTASREMGRGPATQSRMHAVLPDRLDA